MVLCCVTEHFREKTINPPQPLPLGVPVNTQSYLNCPALFTSEDY